MSSELAIEQFGPQLETLRQDCEGVLTVHNTERELIYGRVDLVTPANSEWQILEGATPSSYGSDDLVAEAIVMDHEDDEDKIAAARSGVEEYTANNITLETDRPNTICHVVDRLIVQPQDANNDGGHVGIAEVYDPSANEFVTVTTVAINGTSSYLQARITTHRGRLDDISFVEINEEDQAIMDRCNEVFGPNSLAATLIEGGYRMSLDYHLDEIRQGAEGIVPEDVLNDLLTQVRERAAINERTRLGFNGVTEERIARLREFIADL